MQNPNYFELFGLSPSFQPDTGALRRAFLQLSKQYHPDFFGDATEDARVEALEKSALINKAFSVLSDPDERMRYLLESNGLLGEAAGQPAVPQAFLMEMMDINEALFELEMQPDAALLEKTRADVNGIQESLDEKIKPVLARWRPEHPDSDKDLQTVKDYFLKKRYLLRISGNLSTFGAAF